MEGSKGSEGPSAADEVVMQNGISQSEEQNNDHGIEESKDSDNESVASDSSDDSDMEPFEDYLPKIELLLNDIGLEGFSVQPLHHGYQFMNCVYALTSPKDEGERYVLRIPNCPIFEDPTADDGRCPAILNDAACLGYLADKLPIPRIKAYCATRENALKMPFTVQTMLPGQSLDKVYENMNQSEKFAIIDQIVELQAKLEAVTFATAGTFTPAPGMPDMMRDTTTLAAPSIKMFSQGHEGFVNEPQSLQDRSGADVKALLVNHLHGWIKWEENDLKTHGTHRSVKLRPMLAMLEDMDREGYFEDGPYPIVLYHWDLEPRNIMVQNSGDSWEICGIIDWDDAECVPRPLARRPPDWIWDSEPEMFTGKLDTDHDPTLNLSEDSMALKAHFDTKAAEVLPGYLNDAYGRGRWLRRVWLYAKDMICDPSLLDSAGRLLKEWDERSPVEIMEVNVPEPEPQPAKVQAHDYEVEPAPVAQADKPKGLPERLTDWLLDCLQALRP